MAALKPAALTLLRKAAELDMAKLPRTHEDRVRVVNTIAKIMAQVGFVGPKAEAVPDPGKAFDDHMRMLAEQREGAP